MAQREMTPERWNLVVRVRESLEDSTPLERAEFAAALVRSVYDHVKFSSPEGWGIDGRDGPERNGLADVLNAAQNYYDELRIRGLSPE